MVMLPLDHDLYVYSIRLRFGVPETKDVGDSGSGDGRVGFYHPLPLSSGETNPSKTVYRAF